MSFKNLGNALLVASIATLSLTAHAGTSKKSGSSGGGGKSHQSSSGGGSKKSSGVSSGSGTKHSNSSFGGDKPRSPSSETEHKPKNGSGNGSGNGDHKPKTGTGSTTSGSGEHKPANGNGEKPKTGNGEHKPATGNGEHKPATGSGEKPKTGNGENKPANGREEKPKTGNGEHKPATGNGEHKPATGSGEKPKSGNGEKPKTGNGEHKPAPKVQLTKEQKVRVEERKNIVNKSTQINNQKTVIVQKNVTINKTVNNYHTTYNNNYRPRIVERSYVYNDYWGSYHTYYTGYRSYGFYGGFYYRVTPCIEINTYFYNPLIAWFYVSDWDEYHFRTWYGDDYYAYPYTRFHHVGVFYPTTTFRDMAITVSAMPARTQSIFRTGMMNLTENLAQQLANGLGERVALKENDIVINHYNALGNDAIEVEGFVDEAGQRFAFKALIDLRDPAQTMVFVPTSNDRDPTAEELFTLKEMNNRIERLGGHPFEVPAESDEGDSGETVAEPQVQAHVEIDVQN